MILPRTGSKWRAFFLACLVTIGLFVATLDIFACGDESPFVSPGQSTMVVAGGEQSPVQNHDDGDSGCLHGHCHHVFAHVQLANGAGPALAAIPRERVIAFDTLPPAGHPSQLLRPPRA
jgi:hypothetical protein